jgi:hypothetical protein
VVDVKSAITPTGLGLIPQPPKAESQIEYLAWFRFSVTWTSISGPESDSEVASASRPLTLAPIVPAQLSRVPVALDAAPPEDRLRHPGSAARWEMMVPKMARPPARPVANLSGASALAVPPVKAPPATAGAPSQFVVPSFSLPVRENQALSRYRSPIAFVAIAIGAIGGLIWGLSGPSQSPSGATSSPVKAANWSRQAVSPSGRSLTVYEPSRSVADYRMEFSWVPDSAGAGWVFRTRDANDYYGARLSLQKRGASGVLVAEHFSVFAGAESAHSRKTIPFPGNAGLLRVHMDAIGPVFKLFVENNLADSWTDARLNSGAMGFYDDGDRLPKLLALSFTFINQAATQTAVVSLP